MLGVWLAWDPADFGLAARRVPVEPPAVRTGLGLAVASDLADDSYDLSWLGRLPEDGPRRLKMLRSLLEIDREPLSRHYLYAQLERDLYAYRDVFRAALQEYDEVTVNHDAEMDVIRPAMLAKFGTLPLLETYRQASIRHAKGGLTLTARSGGRGAGVTCTARRRTTRIGRSTSTNGLRCFRDGLVSAMHQGRGTPTRRASP